VLKKILLILLRDFLQQKQPFYSIIMQTSLFTLHVQDVFYRIVFFFRLEYYFIEKNIAFAEMFKPIAFAVCIIIFAIEYKLIASDSEIASDAYKLATAIMSHFSVAILKLRK